tara:strand:+ start:290 stop:559 length:270 start_codon:yes stop_codon:yes gene_type:complete
MAKITSFTVAGPDHPIHTGKWVISKKGPSKQNKEIYMATIKTTVVDSPEKMPNQSSGYSIIIPQVRGTVPSSEQERDKKEPHSDVTSKE